MMLVRKLVLAAAIAMIVPGISWGDKSDRDQVMDISSKQASLEGTKEANVKTLEGDVIITQGTMRITAERAILKDSVNGAVAELFGSGARQITFRQKREGQSDFVEASADRAEYEAKSGTLKLFSKVRFKSGSDLIDSEYVQYNAGTEKMELRSLIPGATPAATTAESRVVIKYQPRKQTGTSPDEGKATSAKTN